MYDILSLSLYTSSGLAGLTNRLLSFDPDDSVEAGRFEELRLCCSVAAGCSGGTNRSRILGGGARGGGPMLLAVEA